MYVYDVCVHVCVCVCVYVCVQVSDRREWRVAHGVRPLLEGSEWGGGGRGRRTPTLQVWRALEGAMIVEVEAGYRRKR